MILLPESCCGFSLQTGARFVSIFQTILAVALLALGVGKLTSAENLEILITNGAFLCIQVVQIIIAYYLFDGSKERNIHSCKIWVAATSILTVATGAYIGYQIYDDSTLRFYSSLYILTAIINVISNIYFMWIIFGFIHLLREEEGEGGTVYNS